LAPRGTRAEHYRAIAAFYGSRLVEDISNPNVPDFVIQRDARHAAHYALAAIALAARPRRSKTPAAGPAHRAAWLMSPEGGLPFSHEPA
jgi:hypothetical protein